MSFLLRNLLRKAAGKLAADPELRKKAIQTARRLADDGTSQMKKIMHDEDPSRAAGRAVKGVLRRIFGE